MNTIGGGCDIRSCLTVIHVENGGKSKLSTPFDLSVIPCRYHDDQMTSEIEAQLYYEHPHFHT